MKDLLRDLTRVVESDEKKPAPKKAEPKKDKPKDGKPEPTKRNPGDPELKVKVVDGKAIRDGRAAKFIGASHCLADPNFIPEGEIWIEDGHVPEDAQALLMNALVQYALMKHGGLTYAKAAKIANGMEDTFRAFKPKVPKAPETDQDKAGEATEKENFGESVNEGHEGKEITIPAGSIVSPDWKVKETIQDVAEGRKSKTNGPLLVSKAGKGRYFLMDGNHRVVEGLQAGEKAFKAVLDHWTPDMTKTGGAHDGHLNSAVRYIDHVKPTVPKDKAVINGQSQPAGAMPEKPVKQINEILPRRMNEELLREMPEQADLGDVADWKDGVFQKVDYFIKTNGLSPKSHVAHVDGDIFFYRDNDSIYWRQQDKQGKTIAAGSFYVPEDHDGKLAVAQDAAVAKAGRQVYQTVLQHMQKRFHLASDAEQSPAATHVWKKVFGDAAHLPDKDARFIVPKTGTKLHQHPLMDEEPALPRRGMR